MRTVMLNIKEIALNVGAQGLPIEGTAHKFSMLDFCSKEVLIKFAEALIAEIAKQNEPVARVNGYYSGHPVIMPLVKYVFPVGLALFTFPPAAEQIANETADAIAKMLENGSFLTPESRVALAANGAAKAIRSGAWKEVKK